MKVKDAEKNKLMSNNFLIRAVKTDASSGCLSGQRTATGRRPLPEGWFFPIPEKAIGLCYEPYLRWKSGAFRLQMMRRTFAVVTVLLALLWVASPTLACLLPGPAMTAAEHACCKQMAKMCGSSRMPQSHSCCQKVQPGNTSILIAYYQSAPALQVIRVLSTPSSPREFELPETALNRPLSDSPPASSVLRI